MKAVDEEGVETGSSEDSNQLSIDDVSNRAMLMLEVGYGLIPLIDDKKESSLVTRITGIRKQTSRDFGFVIPPIRIRDNLSLPPDGYRITIGGVIVADDRVMVDKVLAIRGENSNVALNGQAVKDPTFGIDAVWIEPQERFKIGRAHV